MQPALANKKPDQVLIAKAMPEGLIMPAQERGSQKRIQQNKGKEAVLPLSQNV